MLLFSKRDTIHFQYITFFRFCQSSKEHKQIKKLQKDKETYARLYQDILDEITILRDVKSNLLDNDSLNCLNKRMELLNKFIVSDITLSKRNTAKAMNELSKYILDKETFIDSTVAKRGEEINSKVRENDIYIFDSRLAFHNIPDSFSMTSCK